MDMVNRFEVYDINLNPTVGREIQKIRPCVVISPNEMNVNLETIIIAPLTSTIKNYPSRLTVEFEKRIGSIALDQIRSVDKIRLLSRRGILDTKYHLSLFQLIQEIFTF